MNLPNDPVILLSVVNTKLRDQYKNLFELCDDYDIEESELTNKLEAIGYNYNEKQNQFK
jgi:hypothetical protein